MNILDFFQGMGFMQMSWQQAIMLLISFFLLFLAGALLKAFSCDERLTRTVLVWIMAISYLFYIIRRGQIFSSSCNPFTTFLYLCSLELLPTAALVLSARLL